MSQLAYNLTHAVLWQIAWFAAVIGAGHGLLWLGPASLLPVLVLHAGRHRGEHDRSLAAPAAILVVGVVVDSILVQATGMRIAGPDGWSAWPQPWMIGLWVLLATALPASLAWLSGRPLLGAISGVIAGPLAYLGGVRLGALALPEGWWPVAAIALAWAVALPLAVLIADRIQIRREPCPC
jgi:hypothetical protein